MYRALTAFILGLFWVPSALASGGFVVWMEQSVPDERAIKSSDRKTGPSSHMAHVDLAFPPQPATEDDQKRYEELKKAMADAKARWDEFDVELGIAQDLESKLDVIDVMRDERDLQDMVDARLFQGAAVAKAFDPEAFLSAETADPFRANLPGVEANRPWFLAMGLAPDRPFTKADLADGSTFPLLQALQEPIAGLSRGVVDLSTLPKGTKLVLDGRVIDATQAKIPIAPGVHFVHALRGDVISGRQVVQVDPGASVEPPVLVNQTELDQARAAILAGDTDSFPADVKSSLERLSRYYQGPIFVAAISDKGAVTVLPYARGAELLKKVPVTVVGVGEIGGGVVVSQLFDSEDSTGNLVTAPAANGHLGVEIGIYNGVILGGCDLGFTPANTVTHGNADLTENKSVSVLPQPWGGVGAYILRPTGLTPTLLVAGTYGWLFPAHMGFGARIAFGVPIDQGGTWFRFNLGGATSPKPIKKWQDEGYDQPMHVLFFRLGLAGRF